MADVLKLICAILTCQCWYPFFQWLNANMRALKVGQEYAAKLSGFKLFIFIVFYCYIGCSCVSCAFCCAGCVDIWKAPCEKFQAEPNIMKAYHQLVMLEQNSAEPVVHQVLGKCF